MRSYLAEEYKVPLLLLLCFTLSFILKFGLNIFLAHVFGVDRYGDYALGLQILTVLVPLILIGTGDSINKYFSLYFVQQDKQTLTQYLFWNLRLFIFTSIITLTLIIIVTTLMLSLHVYHIKRIDEHHLLIYMLYVAPIAALTQLITNILLILKNYFFSSYIPNIGQYLILGGLFLVVWMLAQEIHNLLIVTIVFFSYSVIFLTLLFGAKTSISKLRQQISIYLKKGRAHKKEWLITARLLMFNGLIFKIASIIDIISIEIIVKDESAVGHYAAALTIVSVVFFVQKAVVSFIQGQISSALDRGHKEELQKKLRKLTRLQTIILVSICLLLAWNADRLLGYFGPTFLVAKIPLLILIFSSGLTGLTSLCPYILMYSSHEKELLYINFYTFLVLAIACPVLTYFYGITGAALAMAIVNVAAAFIIMFFTEYYFSLKTYLFL